MFEHFTGQSRSTRNRFVARTRRCPSPNRPAHPCIAHIELLEARQLLAVTPFANVNFQPASTPVPAGYLADTGAAYADRGNGFTYGWSADTSAYTRDRTVSTTRDSRYATLTFMQRFGAFSWEIAVPDGTYQVHLVAGDAVYTDSVYKLNVEDALAVNGIPISTNSWVEGTITVPVTDGRLTITNADGSSNNKLDYVDIATVTPDTADVLLSAPANLTARAVSPKQIDLAWTLPTTPVAGFKIDRSADGATFSTITTVPATASGYSDTSVSDATTFYYRVYAYTTTSTSPAASAQATTPLAAPASPRATASSSAASITLNWTDASSKETGYIIERSRDNVTFTEIARTGANVTSYTSGSLLEQATYAYRIKTYNATATAAATVVSAKTPIAAPTSLTPRAFKNVARIDLSWTNNSAVDTGIIIERSRSGGVFTELARVAATASRYTDVKITAKTAYTYRIRAYNTAGQSATISVAATSAPFRVFQETFYLNRPDLTSLGVEDIYVNASGYFYKVEAGGSYDMNTPSESGTRLVADQAAARNQILVMDIEQWCLDIRKVSTAVVQANMQKLSQIIAWIRSEQPTLQIGFYGLAPIREYYPAVNYFKAQDNLDDRWWQAQLPAYTQTYLQWQAANDYLTPLISQVDIVFPSLYTFVNIPGDWVYYAKGNIAQARRYGKPVIPFIWNEFHNGTPLIGQVLDPTFWRLQLDTLRQLADGLVIWGGMKYSTTQSPYTEQWDETAPWWLTTKDFLAQ